MHSVTQSLLASEAGSKHQLAPGSKWPWCSPYLFNACSIDSFSWFTSFMYDETRNRNSSKLDKSSGRSFRRRAQSSRTSCGLEQAYKRGGKQKSYCVILWTVIPTPNMHSGQTAILLGWSLLHHYSKEGNWTLTEHACGVGAIVRSK